MRTTQQNLINQNRDAQRKVTEQTNIVESLKHQVSEITNALKSKDAMLAKESRTRRDAEIELEKLQVKLEEATRSLDAERSKGTENSQLEALRSIALCPVCNSRWKDSAIKTCGHVFCSACANERITSRSRKCPNCGRPFAVTDIIPVFLS